MPLPSAWGLSIALALAPASASPAAPEVLLGATPAQTPTADTIALELGALGHTITRTEPEADCAALLTRTGVVGLTLTEAPAQAVVCLEMDDGSVMRRSVALAPTSDEAERRVAALRATELVLATLQLRELEREAAATTPSPPLPPPPRPRAPAPRVEPPDADAEAEARSWGSMTVDVLPSVAWSRGGIGPSMQLQLAVAYWSRPRVGFGLDASLPLVRGLARNSRGVAHVWPAIFLMAWFVQLTPPERNAYVHLDLGLGLALAHMRGHTRTDLETESPTPICGATGIGLRAGGSVHRNVRLEAGLSLSVLVTGIAVEFADQEVATFGLPVIGAGAGLQFVGP